MTVNREALLRTADWLEANPDKHITGDLARNTAGFPVNPIDEEATCFCALGRLAFELNFDLEGDDNNFGYDGTMVACGLPQVSAYRVWRLNDLDAAARDFGNPAVIGLLRELANG